MGQLTLAIRELRENFNPAAIMVGKDRVDVRKARKKIIKADKEEHLSKISFKKLLDASMKGERDAVLSNFSDMCKHFQNQIEDDTEALEDLIQMTRREFISLRTLKANEKDKANEDQIIRAMKKFQSNSEKWFKLIQQRNSFTLYMSDIASKKQEVLHIADPFNLQADVKKVKQYADKAKSASKKGRKSPSQLNLEKKYLEAFNSQLDSELKKLDLIWQDVIAMIQLEMEEFRKEVAEIKSKLQQINLPEADLQEIDKLATGTDSEFNKSLNGLQNQLNGLIKEEQSA